MINKKRALKILMEAIEKNQVDAELKEAVEVAIECLESGNHILVCEYGGKCGIYEDSRCCTTCDIYPDCDEACETLDEKLCMGLRNKGYNTLEEIRNAFPKEK